MIVSSVVAVAKNGVIGNKGQLPRHISSDLKLFKTITMGGAVIMGRKCYESIGKPLPGRMNIVVTRQSDYPDEGIAVAHSVEEAISTAHSLGYEEAFVIGGAEIYELSNSYWDKIYYTLVEMSPEGDTYFPEIEWSEWISVSNENLERGPKDDAEVNFSIWERIK